MSCRKFLKAMPKDRKGRKQIFPEYKNCPHGYVSKVLCPECTPYPDEEEWRREATNE